MSGPAWYRKTGRRMRNKITEINIRHICGRTGGQTMVYETYSAEETAKLGEEIARQAEPGSVYALLGDLGTGKTVFTQGVARGLGIEEPVCSPTFTILQVYEEGRMPFYHFDVYRIAGAPEMDDTGYEDYIYGDGLAMIEWADLIRDILPPEYDQIRIEKDLEKGFDYRRITIERIRQ